MASAFKISDAAALALHAVTMLIQHPQTSLATRTIAAALKCSEAHLSKVMQRLVRAGIVTSVRGPKGGFKLAQPQGEFNILHVLEAIEGPLSEGGCLLNPAQCDGKECLFGALSVHVNAIVRKELSRISAADLRKRKQIPLPDTQVELG
jgi:Rrf2 family protein